MIPIAPDGHVDLEVYNEASCWTICPTRLDHLDSEALHSEEGWSDAVHAGAVIPILLADDSAFSCRVVVGRELSGAEQTEVMRLRWWLELPEGGLTIAGGTEFAQGEFTVDEGEEFHHQLDVPPGRYRVDVLTYAAGINGELGLDEPIGSWWRRTRPEQPFPRWLELACAWAPDRDPGHDDHWIQREEELSEELSESWESKQGAALDFLVHLTPLAEGAPMPERPNLRYGAFEGGERVAQPRCPEALLPGPLIRPRGMDDEDWDDDGYDPADIVDVAARVAGCELTPLEGGSVELACEHLADAYCLAFWCYDSIDGQVEIVAPSEAAVGDWSGLEQTDVQRDGARVSLRWPETGARWELMTRLIELGPALAELPDGTVLELMTAPDPDIDEDEDDDEPRRDPAWGRVRLRGVTQAGRWQIRESHPPLSAATLREVLALADVVRAAGEFALRPGEAEALRERAECDALLAELKLKGDRAIIRDMHDQLARHLFQLRCADALPMSDLHRSNLRDQARWDQVGASLERLFSAPTSGPVIHYGGHGEYSRSARSLLEAPADPAVARREAELREQGLTPLGELVSDGMLGVLINGWHGGDRYVALLSGMVGLASVDVFSLFADGSSLTTTTTPGEDDLERGLYREVVEGGVDGPPLGDLLAAHDARVAQLATRLGPLRQLTCDAHGLAEAIDDFLDRQAL